MKLKFLLSTVVLSPLVLQDAAAEDLPLDYFFKNPEFAGFQVSPNGKELAAMVNFNGRMNLAMMDLRERNARAITNVTEQDVSGLMWANNERILFFMDKDGSESFGIFAVNTDGSLPRTLVERNPGNVVGWFTDWDGNVMGAAFQDELETGFMLLTNP